MKRAYIFNVISQGKPHFKYFPGRRAQAPIKVAHDYIISKRVSCRAVTENYPREVSAVQYVRNAKVSLSLYIYIFIFRSR